MPLLATQLTGFGDGGAVSAGISRIGSQTGTNSATIPAHQIGDLIVAWAFRDGSTTAPSEPAGEGWTSSANVGTSCSGRLAYKTADSESETTGTFTNATSFIVVVYRNAAKGSTQGYLSGVGTTITFEAATMDVTNGSSWVIGFCGHRQTNVAIETAPNLMTNVTSVSDATDEAALHDTNGGVTEWAQTGANVGGSSSGWLSVTTEIKRA